jgi:predicted transcriptional regulator/predicted phosphodiesterase
VNTPISFQELQRVAQLKENHSRKEVAQILGLTERQVIRYLQKYKQTMQIHRNEIIAQTNREIADLIEEFSIENQEPCDKHAYDQLQELAENWGVNKAKGKEETINYWNLTEYAENDEVIIVFLGDVHWGSRHCNRKFLFNVLKWIAATPNVFVMLMGDMIEMSTKQSVGGGVYEQVQPPQEQIKDTIAYLKPIRHKILGYFSGNHEFRAYKDLGIDVADLISSVIEVPYLGFTKLTTIQVGDHLYDIAGTHGTGGSKKPHTKLAKVLNLTDLYDADLYVMGHVHDKLEATKTYRRRVGKELQVFQRHFLVTGHFLNWKTSYAEMAQFGPGNIGSPFATLHKNKFKINISK